MSRIRYNERTKMTYNIYQKIQEDLSDIESTVQTLFPGMYGEANNTYTRLVVDAIKGEETWRNKLSAKDYEAKIETILNHAYECTNQYIERHKNLLDRKQRLYN